VRGWSRVSLLNWAPESTTSSARFDNATLAPHPLERGFHHRGGHEPCCHPYLEIIGAPAGPLREDLVEDHQRSLGLFPHPRPQLGNLHEQSAPGQNHVLISLKDLRELFEHPPDDDV